MLQETTELLRRGYIAVCFLFAGLLTAESGRQQRDAGNVLLAFSAALLCVFVFYMSSDIYCVASGGQMIVVLLFLPVLLFSTPAFAQIDFTGEWAPAPARVCGSYVPGFFHRRVGRKHAHDHDYSPEGELHAPQWRAPQRESQTDRTLDAACRLPDDCQRHRGSGVPHGAPGAKR